jgi:AbrB family looped-hinge helix DNA binding protein
MKNITIQPYNEVSKMPISKLGQRRQIVIPKDICDNLGMEVGDFVEVMQDGGRIVIKPKQVVDLEDMLSPEDEESVQQGLEDVERGEVKPWSKVKHDLGL